LRRLLALALIVGALAGAWFYLRPAPKSPSLPLAAGSYFPDAIRAIAYQHQALSLLLRTTPELSGAVSSRWTAGLTQVLTPQLLAKETQAEIDRLLKPGQKLACQTIVSQPNLVRLLDALKGPVPAAFTQSVSQLDHVLDGDPAKKAAIHELLGLMKHLRAGDVLYSEAAQAIYSGAEKVPAERKEAFRTKLLPAMARRNERTLQAKLVEMPLSMLGWAVETAKTSEFQICENAFSDAFLGVLRRDIQRITSGSGS
jgi:hypothetical protein